MIQKAPSSSEKSAIHTSIYANAPAGWTLYVPGKYLIYPKRPSYIEPPPPRPPKPSPEPSDNPTLTPEELEKIKLAYAETVRDIERRGKMINMDNRNSRADRNTFMRNWQGRPDTASASAVRNEKLEFYNSKITPETNIVALARKEPNNFRKVRMIHDWVADIFAYDYDLLWWMDNVSRQNAEYTLGTILKLERGVCFEYAILFWFLMDASGIDTYVVCESYYNYKKGENEAHAIIWL
jgi:transglutaminase-like putative cysteine protease